MKTIITLIIFSLVSLITVNGQDARKILDKANQAYHEAGVVEASFTVNTEDVKNKTTYSQDGKAYLKENKFKIDMVDGITWFDGTTQWVYVKGSEEVNVSNPTGEELATISPVILLSIYKSGFKVRYDGEKKEKGKIVYSIELIPESKVSEFSKIYVNIDKATNLFTSIKMISKDGLNNHLVVNKLQTKLSLPESTFAFNKKDYPKVEIIDLR